MDFLTLGAPATAHGQKNGQERQSVVEVCLAVILAQHRFSTREASTSHLVATNVPLETRLQTMRVSPHRPAS